MLQVAFTHCAAAGEGMATKGSLGAIGQLTLYAFSPVQWIGLLSATSGAAAALTGLIFVAISINLEKTLVVPGIPGRAGESIIQLIGVLIVSTITLAPGQSQPAARLGVALDRRDAVDGMFDLRSFADRKRSVPGVVGLDSSCRRRTIGNASFRRCRPVATYAFGPRTLLAPSGVWVLLHRRSTGCLGTAGRDTALTTFGRRRAA